MMSDTRPLTGVKRVIASVYEVATQEYSDGVASNTSAILGRAVAMICS